MRLIFAENENNQMYMCDHKLHCCLNGMSLSLVANTAIKKNETNYKKFATGLQRNKNEQKLKQCKAEIFFIRTNVLNMKWIS